MGYCKITIVEDEKNISVYLNQGLVKSIMKNGKHYIHQVSFFKISFSNLLF
ncbi:hypothetical protein [Cytobacillus firmus]|uniref:hypothetical protein n=1 Tax=Cytobacillus firmus TaxID=1399 RepID=UPI0024C12A68|nr:hypothetical protein [Cytobacillus firmus]WHY61478.1 hypothetical protein QNH42_23400 [Cytobacillus firmus]